jgi:hypothetical protein
VQLVGIYPAGNLVRLDGGEIAVVLKAHAPDPYRPRVRVLIGRDGARLETPRDINLFEAEEGSPNAIQSPLDPTDYDIDPLIHL